MTRLLDEAIRRLDELPPERQDALARRILDEVDDTQRWDDHLDATADRLDELADDVLARHASGKAIDQGWDDL
jgi:hypothetical protein